MRATPNAGTAPCADMRKTTTSRSPAGLPRPSRGPTSFFTVHCLATWSRICRWSRSKSRNRPAAWWLKDARPRSSARLIGLGPMCGKRNRDFPEGFLTWCRHDERDSGSDCRACRPVRPLESVPARDHRSGSRQVPAQPGDQRGQAARSREGCEAFVTSTQGKTIAYVTSWWPRTRSCCDRPWRPTGCCRIFRNTGCLTILRSRIFGDHVRVSPGRPRRRRDPRAVRWPTS